MKKYKIAICGFDEEYVFRLMNYINGHMEYQILAFAFTEEGKIEEYLSEDSFKFILAEEDFSINTEEEVIRLCKEEGGRGIYKYQPASEIVFQMQNRVQKNFSAPLTERVNPAKDKRLLAVYSPVGRSGKTNLALAMAAQSQSLYIGMEEYSKLPNTYTTMSDICYWIRKKEEKILDKVEEGAVIEEGVLKLLSPFTYLDLKEMSLEEYAWFFEKLKESERFSAIIVDIGSGCLCNYLFLSLFEQVFVPILSGISKEKEKHFRKVLKFVGLEQTDTVFSFVRVPNQRFEQAEMKNFAKNCLKNR